MVTVRIRRGKYQDMEPRNDDDVPDFEIDRPRELLDVVRELAKD